MPENTGRTSILVRNASDCPITIILEPWADEQILQPGAETQVAVTNGGEGLAVEHHRDALVVWAEESEFLAGATVGPVAEGPAEIQSTARARLQFLLILLAGCILVAAAAMFFAWLTVGAWHGWFGGS